MDDSQNKKRLCSSDLNKDDLYGNLKPADTKVSLAVVNLPNSVCA